MSDENIVKQLQILKLFKKQLITFFDELISQFPSEADLIIIRIFIKDQIPISDIILHFIQFLLPIKNIIDKRSEEFFLGNMSDTIFEELSNDKVNHFKKLWRSGVLDQDDKNCIWSWFDSFILLSEKYKQTLSKK